MNQKIKTLSYIAGFVVLILAAVFGYNYLTGRYNAPNPLDLPSKTNSQTSVADTQSPNPSTSGKEQESEVPSEGGSNQENRNHKRKILKGNRMRKRRSLWRPWTLLCRIMTETR